MIFFDVSQYHEKDIPTVQSYNALSREAGQSVPAC